MKNIGYYFGVPLQSEVILLILCGICSCIFDASLLDLNSNLRQIWTVSLDETKFTGKAESVLKYMLSGIVLVQTFSVHIHLAFYIVMLWPAVFVSM